MGNPDNLADGFKYVECEEIDSEKAIPICEKAIKENPTVLRFVPRFLFYVGGFFAHEKSYVNNIGISP